VRKCDPGLCQVVSDSVAGWLGEGSVEEQGQVVLAQWASLVDVVLQWYCIAVWATSQCMLVFQKVVGVQNGAV